MNPELKAVLYARVSTDDQILGTSLDEQRAACEAKARQLGAVIVGYYEDGGVSGVLYTIRSGMQQALAALEDGTANRLIVTKVDRLLREAGQLPLILKRIEAAGAELVFCDMSFPATSVGGLMLGMLAQIAQYQRQDIVERCRNGGRQRAREGIQTKRSWRPYGYYLPMKADVLRGDYTSDQEGKHIVIEEEASWVRKMFEWVAGGASLRGVARRLTEQGVETPRDAQSWGPSTVKRILNRPDYRGEAVYGRHQRQHDESLMTQEYQYGKMYTQPFVVRERPESEWIQYSCPAIVDEQTWKVCNDILARNKSTLGGRPERKYTLTGLLRCPNCKRTMSGAKRVRKGAKGPVANEKSGHSSPPVPDYYYECRHSRPAQDTGSDKPVTCTRTPYAGIEAENGVFLDILDKARQPEAIAAALQVHRRAKNQDLDMQGIARLRRELDKVKRLERRTILAQIDGLEAGADSEVYKTLLREVSQKRADLEARLEAATAQHAARREPEYEDDAAIVAKALEALDEVLTAPEITDSEKRGLLALVVKGIYPAGGPKTTLYTIHLKGL